MADNVELNAMTGGAQVAADEIGGVKHQRVKIQHGADGSATDASAADPLPVAASPVAGTATTGNITASGQSISMDVSKASNVVLYVTGTFAGFNGTFEGSIDGGTNWFAIQAARTNANTIELTTGAISAAPAYAWELSVNALTHIRLRATALTSGTVAVRMLPGAYATEPIPAIQTHPVTGSGNFAVTMAANATTTPAKARDGAAGASDTGIPAWFVRRDTPTTVTPVAGDWEPAQIDSQGSQWVREKPNTTSAVTSVAAATSSTTLLALNAQRRGATIHNDSTAILYLKLGATASTSSFTVKIAADGYYEVPFGYTGVIDGIWAAANGNARVTELSS